MSEQQTMPDVVQAIDIDAPVERVWAEITRLGQVSDIMFHTVLETDFQPGSPLRYYSPDRKRIWIVGEIVEVSPPTRLVHTYRFTDITDETETLVTWDLQEREGGVRVTVSHSRFTDQAKTHKKVSGGWNQILGLLKTVVETGKVPGKFRVMYTLMDWMQFVMPKSTKAEEVLRGS